jgi:hypothetical protein
MRHLRLCVIVIASGVLLSLAFVAHANPYAGSAEVHDSVTVSGAWSSVQWYESDGCYSGVGDPAVSDWKDRAQGDTPIDLSTQAGDAYGTAASGIKVDAPGLKPSIGIHSSADVHDLPDGDGHWASAYSEGGANWLTSSATQTVTVSVEYSYDLDLTQANPLSPYAFAKIYVAFWGPGGSLLLAPDAEFLLEGDYLVKTVQIDLAGGGTGAVTGSKSWDVGVTSGDFYSFWNMAWVETWTDAQPTSLEPTEWGHIKALYK